MSRFDRAYYSRFYGSGRSRIQGPREVARLARVITAVVETSHGPIDSVLEVGAGTGLWRDWFAARRPDVRYRSTDASAHACQEYGHERRDITRWTARARFDLVICQGVLPYLSDDGAARAIRNLAAMSNPFLYLEAVTDKDLASIADSSCTDPAMKGRSSDWYRRRLGRHFRQVGFGLWVRRDAEVVLWDLEQGAD